MEFKDFYSKEQYQQLHKLHRTKDENNRPVKEFYDSRPIFAKAIENFLKMKNKNNQLVDIEYAQSHDTYIQKLWDNIRSEESLSEYANSRLQQLFSMTILDTFREKTIDKGYEELNDMFNQGDFEYFLLNGNEKCTCCDAIMYIEFKNWIPSFQTYNLKTKQNMQPESCFDNQITELEIEFKTSELLLADWFRIKEFTEQVAYNKDYIEPSINSSLGRVNSTKYALENFNFLTVHIGNSSPEIFTNGKDIIFGREDEKRAPSKKFENAGYICTDLWNATIIEKQQLINIIANKIGLESAINKVEEYLEHNDVETLDIKPGTYKLRFHASYEEFKNLEQDKVIPKSIIPYFTLKQAEPTLVKKMKMK